MKRGEIEELVADVLAIGGGTGGTAAAIQAARRGAKTILVSDGSWLGGMLTSAAVAAPDGNELAAFQTGLWGAFLRSLHQRQPEGLDWAWASFFTFDPRTGAAIFADWVRALPNLKWIWGQVPLEVYRTGDRLTGIRSKDYSIRAQIVLDGTELGDLLALADVPHRWGWEWQAQWGEPSAPITANALTKRYPVQAPTWVVLLRDFGPDAVAPEIPAPPLDNPEQFIGAWEGYTPERFLNYSQLPGNLYALNWPQRGNDYGEGVGRLVESEAARQQFLQEAYWHSQSFARSLQSHFGRRYGLATGVFPVLPGLHRRHSAFALHPYYRESRRLVGLVTVREQDILPQSGGCVAKLPPGGGIAIGNYPNDHHYPGYQLPLQSKSLIWGGRTTGTPFSLPYGCLVPADTDGLLVCEKNISVSHIANGATRLQPLVMNLGQAAGMAAALCVERGCQPRDLPVQVLQNALLKEPTAPAAVIPLFDSLPHHPDWLHWQRYYLEHRDRYPDSGEVGRRGDETMRGQTGFSGSQTRFSGIFQRHSRQNYTLTQEGHVWTLVTLQPEIDRCWLTCESPQSISGWGCFNRSGNWLRVEGIESPDSMFHSQG